MEKGLVTPKKKVKIVKATTSFRQTRKNSPLTIVKKKLSKSFTEKKSKDVRVNEELKTTGKKKFLPLPECISKFLYKGHWKKRPKPAHSGVPLPEKMRKLILDAGDDFEQDGEDVLKKKALHKKQ